jgi:hypothetical protein
VIDEVIRGYRSFNQSQPYSQAMYYGALMEYENRFTNEQYIKVLEDGSKDLSKFAMDLQVPLCGLGNRHDSIVCDSCSSHRYSVQQVSQKSWCMATLQATWQ